MFFSKIKLYSHFKTLCNLLYFVKWRKLYSIYLMKLSLA